MLTMYSARFVIDRVMCCMQDYTTTCTCCIGERHSETNQYYYGQFRYHARHPWPKRNLKSSLKDMRRVDIEDRQSVRACMAKECGFTGLSILHRLNCLYGFDVLLDTVYDAMHNIPI